MTTSPDHADWTRTTCAAHYMTDERCGSWCEPARLAFIHAAEDLDEFWRLQAIHLEYRRRYGLSHQEYVAGVVKRRSVA